MPRRFLPRVPEVRRPPELRVHDFDEVAVPYTIDQARQEAARCLRCRRAPCTLACPLGTRADVYVPLIAEGRLDEAAAVLAENDPMPAICARVCHRPCEAVCLAGKVDAPVAIRALKHFLVEATEGHGSGIAGPPAVGRCGEPVAVIGAGPSGLVAARTLADLGRPVTVFDALPEAGGLLRWGIPAYRLPHHVTAAAIEQARAAGVVFRLGVRLGRDVTVEELFAAGYRAVLLAIGAHRCRSLGVPGGDLPRVIAGLDLLRDVAAGSAPPIAGRVVVVGGGDAAIDAARSARRLGASTVTLVYRRSRTEMPARPAEVAEAEEEGIAFRFLAAPDAIEEGVDGVRVVQFQSMRLEPNQSGGRPLPVPIPGACWELPADVVVAAVGQEPDLDGALPGVPVATRDGMLDIDAESFGTSIPGVFACGDAAGGRANVTDAAALGRRAAQAIHDYVKRVTSPATVRFEQCLYENAAGS
ncbi:MAG: FAD-dependent oxidoreductase [Chloroflexi bacterium]|nr:FAD-dependent oxidoreductase [Chloroflexota bacterium]